MTNDSHPPPEPPWLTVIATTLRLWMQRRFARVRNGGTKRARRHRGLIEAAAAVVIVAAALAAAAIVGRTQGLTASQTPSSQASAARPPTSPSSSAAAPAPGSSAALVAAAMSRQQAAAWVAAQVDHGTIVACDPLTCSALQQYRFPAGNLSPITASSADPLGTGIVVSTAAVRNQIGPRLNTVYAPLVIASFGTGADLVQIRATEVGGATAYLASVEADVQARTQAGNELAGNKAITEPATASAELSSGHVDSRLLVTLAALTHKFAVRIVSFSDAGPGAAASVPLRQMTITAPTASYLSQLLGFLHVQRPPLLPLVSQHRSSTTTQVSIQFSAPSPLGLLNNGISP